MHILWSLKPGFVNTKTGSGFPSLHGIWRIQNGVLIVSTICMIYTGGSRYLLLEPEAGGPEAAHAIEKSGQEDFCT